MENQLRPRCPENEELALYMWSKRQEMAEPRGLSDKLDATLLKAYRTVCNTKTPIKTIKEFSEIKGVGKWILRLMQGFFKTDDDDDVGDSDSEQVPQKGKKKSTGKRRYVPQKNSVPYALLITLYRGIANGRDFMRKQELIDAAELSGLSRVPIAAELGKGKPAQFGNSSSREWYSGWNSMKTLINKGLVVKSSCPAKYMLTQEGREAARECLSRGGLADSVDHLDTMEILSRDDIQTASDPKANCLPGEVTPSVNLNGQMKPLDVPVEYLEKFSHMGYSVEQIYTAFAKVSQETLSKDIASLLPAVVHHLQKDQVDKLLSVCRQTNGKDSHATSNTYNAKNAGTGSSVVEENGIVSCRGMQAQQSLDSLTSTDSAQSSFTLRACSSSDYPVHRSSDHTAAQANLHVTVVPPLRSGESFADVYDVILILDDREQFINSSKGLLKKRAMEDEFKIRVEVRRLLVGDAIWIARHKQLQDEYVLDFIVERKRVDDLRSSIRDTRYRDQKLRLLSCGLQKLIYIVEGDPNVSDAAESIKTACFTTEILEGFDVQRTSGLGETLRKYGYLTLSITNYYKSLASNDKNGNTRICLSFGEFMKKCQDLDQMTVSDVFAIQLMQVPQVTEEIALAVLSLYPTVVSLARAYSLIDGDVHKQEEMLMAQSNNSISRAASRNIFKLVWGD